MSEVRNAYLRASGLIALSSKSARKAALDRAHDIRKFEIELYWKRATYFWVLQASVFTAFGLIWKEGNLTKWGLIPVALSCLGSLTALSGWLSSLGSKFWQSNWEHHIDMLEDEFEGRLHKTAWVGPYGLRWSVSGVNERLAFFFVMFWLFAIWFAADNFTSGKVVWGFHVEHIDGGLTVLFLLLLATFAGALWSVLRISDLRGELVQLDLDERSKKVQQFPRFWRSGPEIQILKRSDIK